MLGCNVNTDHNPPKSCIEIREWTAYPQSKGCIKYKGRYYVNKIDGNTARPDEGLASGLYAVGSADYCDIIKYHAVNQSTCPESNAFIKFFEGIHEYTDCDKNRIFDCDDFIIFKNKSGDYELHQSLIDENDRHPHDREAWKNHGTFSNVLHLFFDESDGRQLTLAYYEPCTGSNCFTVYNTGACVVERVDSGKTDNCGNPIYDELIYQSLVDKNTDRPSLGAAKDEPTWAGPYTECEYLNRPVGYTVNGDPIKQGDDHVLVSKHDTLAPLLWQDVEDDECLPNCDHPTRQRLTLCADQGLDLVEGCLNVKISDGLAFDDDGAIVVDPADDSIIVDEEGVRVGKIGVDPSGEDVNAGDCFITCDDVDNETVVLEDGKLKAKSYIDPNGETILDGDCLLTCDDVDNETIVLEDGKLAVNPDGLCAAVEPVESVDISAEVLTCTQEGLRKTPLAKAVADNFCESVTERLPDEDTRLDLFCDVNGLGKAAPAGLNLTSDDESVNIIETTDPVTGEVTYDLAVKEYVDTNGDPIPDNDCLLTCDDVDGSTIKFEGGKLKAIIPDIPEAQVQKMFYALPNPMLAYNHKYTAPADPGLDMSDFGSVDSKTDNFETYFPAAVLNKTTHVIVQVQQSRRAVVSGPQTEPTEMFGGVRIFTPEGYDQRRVYNLVNLISPGQDREGRDNIYYVPIGASRQFTVEHLIRKFPDGPAFDFSEDVATVFVLGAINSMDAEGN